MKTNAFGGSSLHQDLLDQYLLSTARDMVATEQGLHSPRMSVLLAAISTLVFPYTDPRIDALAQGREGISDGKVWFVRQDLLVEKIQEAKNNAQALAWFEESLREVIAIARGREGQQVQAVPSKAMAKLLTTVLDPSTRWQERMGYDDGHFDEKPVLNAIQTWESMGLKGFLSEERVLGTGTYNKNAQDIIAALWNPGVPEAIANPESKEPYKSFLKSFMDLSQKNHLHSFALSSIAYLGIAQRYLGFVSHEKHFQAPLDKLGKIGYEENIQWTAPVRNALIDVLSEATMLKSGQDFKTSLLQENEPEVAIQKSKGPKP